LVKIGIGSQCGYFFDEVDSASSSSSGSLSLVGTGVTGMFREVESGIVVVDTGRIAESEMSVAPGVIEVSVV
jgi:hypothetical protein